MLSDLHLNGGSRKPEDDAVIALVIPPLSQHRQPQRVPVEDEDLLVVRRGTGESDSSYVQMIRPHGNNVSSAETTEKGDYRGGRPN